MEHLDRAALEAGVDHIRQAPSDAGTLELIVARPASGERTVLDEAELSTEVGLVGDSWQTRGSRMTEDGSSHPDMQLNVMNVRSTALVAQTPERWPLAGDQLYVDFDISGANLPAGTQLQIGTAVIEITPEPHTGCAKFTERFGLEAMRFVNSPVGRELNLRGICAKVVTPGTIRRGDTISKV